MRIPNFQLYLHTHAHTHTRTQTDTHTHTHTHTHTDTENGVIVSTTTTFYFLKLIFLVTAFRVGSLFAAYLAEANLVQLGVSVHCYVSVGFSI